MRLPTWEVKWIKNNFEVDALELKFRQQEEKIKKLTNKVVRLKWDALPEDERRWALNAFIILTWKLFPSSSEETEFITKYIEQQEAWDVITHLKWEDLPF